MKGKGIHMLTWILLIIGGLNWGLSALSWNVVGYLGDGLSKIIYILIGLSAIVLLVTHKKDCRACMGGGGGSSMPSNTGSSGMPR